MKQIVDKLNKIAKKIDDSVELPNTDLITDSLDAITKAYGGTPNDSTLIVDKLDDIYNNISLAVSGNIEITENGENINVAPYATATVNVSGGGGGGTPQGVEVTLAEEQTFTGSDAGSEVIFGGDLSVESAIENMSELPDSIIVVYDDITYECSKQTRIYDDPDDPYYYYGANLEEEPLDWSAYPFSVEMGVGSDGYITLLVGNENQHTVKVSYYDTTLNITSSGTYDVTDYLSVVVDTISILSVSNVSGHSVTVSGTTYYGIKWDCDSEPNNIVMARTHATTSNSDLLIGFNYYKPDEYIKAIVLSSGSLSTASGNDFLIGYDNGTCYVVATNLSILGTDEDPGMAYTIVCY